MSVVNIVIIDSDVILSHSMQSFVNLRDRLSGG